MLAEKENINRRHGWFVRHWAHDQRAAANAMSGAVELMESDGEFKQEYMELLKAGLQMLEEGSSNLIDYSLPDTSNKNEIFNLVEMLESCQNLYYVTANFKNVRIILEIHGSAPENIRGDRAKIQRVVTNLLSNAIKFSLPGQAVTLRAHVKDAFLFLQVEDKGPGIPLDKQREIFLPYIKLIDEMPGTGLGLAICKRFAVEMGGEIVVNSSLNRGSVFSLIIKVVNV